MRATLNANRGRQGGAALIVGLLLLLVLTLLAVAGMNSASLEYVMAGNEQYRSNAFQAAEAGIAQTLQTPAVYQPDVLPNTPVPPGANGADAWTAAVWPMNSGFASQVWGFDPNSVLGLFYEIRSTGTAVRGAQAANVQGVLQYVPYNMARRPDPNLPNQNLQ
jgi:hypothetical protein